MNARGGGGAVGGSGGQILVAGGLTTVVTGPGMLDVSGGSVVAPIQGGPGGIIVLGPGGGEIWAENRPEGGAVFGFRLPVAAA